MPPAYDDTVAADFHTHDDAEERRRHADSLLDTTTVAADAASCHKQDDFEVRHAFDATTHQTAGKTVIAVGATMLKTQELHCSSYWRHYYHCCY